MFKRKPSRSREFRRNSQVIDMAEEREARRERRAQKKIEEEEQRRLEEAEKKANKRKKKQRRNRRLAYFVGVLVIAGLLVYSAWDIISLRLEKAQLEKQQKELTLERESLQNELDSVQDEDYVRQQAREQLKLINPGETLYVLPKDENASSTSTSEDGIDEETTDSAVENTGDR